VSAAEASEPLVVEVERSGLVESVHLVDVAVADVRGRMLAWAGEPATVAYLRSSAKPVQATVCLEAGWKPSRDWQIAIACASHNGEPEHVEAARSILAGAGLDASALRCPPARPVAPEAGTLGPDPIYHNCSGKHAAMLATCSARGWTLDEYPAGEHPLQRAVAERVASLAGASPRAVGVDGCGVPTFALTLAESATAFARLPANAPAATAAMRAHPFLVAGTGRLCTAVMSSLAGVILKIGAEGIACAALPESGIGFALKARDGAPRGRETAVVAVLEMLGMLSEPQPESLASFGRPPVSGGGETVGAVRWRGSLRRM
jgi:L-asparaginase II